MASYRTCPPSPILLLSLPTTPEPQPSITSIFAISFDDFEDGDNPPPPFEPFEPLPDPSEDVFDLFPLSPRFEPPTAPPSTTSTSSTTSTATYTTHTGTSLSGPCPSPLSIPESAFEAWSETELATAVVGHLGKIFSEGPVRARFSRTIANETSWTRETNALRVEFNAKKKKFMWWFQHPTRPTAEINHSSLATTWFKEYQKDTKRARKTKNQPHALRELELYHPECNLWISLATLCPPAVARLEVTATTEWISRMQSASCPPAFELVTTRKRRLLKRSDGVQLSTDLLHPDTNNGPHRKRQASTLRQQDDEDDFQDLSAVLLPIRDEPEAGGEEATPTLLLPTLDELDQRLAKMA